MQHHKFFIPFTLPTLNEYINASRTNKYQSAGIKKGIESDIGYCIKAALRNIKFEKPVTIDFKWVEKNRRRDKDNIAFAKKFILDALVKMGVLANDNWAYVEGFTDNFAVDKNNAGVEVVIRSRHDGT